MAYTIKSADLPTLIAELTRLQGEFERRFGQLSVNQLNWKPNPEEWSIGYCLEHIMVANQGYVEPVNQILSATKKTSIWERVPILPGIFGPMLIRTLEPGSKGFVPAPKVFLPSMSNVTGDVCERFRRQTQEIITLMERCQRIDPSRIIITSPASAFITYSLLDAFRIIVVHLQHHLHQTSALLELAAFPKE
ncbi:hypothetical protein OSCT_1458 [Oscillochloris trichoides DG-6]|uniref:DinB-like domain-containing protein n=1 Tax=Oscillochloris trichoides DG-6 TaxID=765420 RepID=E1IDQ7_9CHLR|nr:DinB family protein [Oscillochloris trichoides]EFO80685.1 hypothetical protein OSCT_1458 [Oscillochloris trichoides DG-6]